VARTRALYAATAGRSNARRAEADGRGTIAAHDGVRENEQRGLDC
jgi:hypothetical protein